MTQPDPAPVLDLIEAFRRSKTMFTAVTLGMFDRLEEGPADAATLARHLGADCGALERLLDACVGLTLLSKQNGVYANQPAASVYLARRSPRAMTGYIQYSNQVLYHLWGHLEDAVREGSHRWRQAFGFEAAAIFDHIFRTEDDKRMFLMGMHGYGLLSSPAVVASFDLSRFRRLVDLGGATGHLAVAACERYPAMSAAVFDLPAVIQIAREQVAATAVAARVELIAGDFFQDSLPEADLFAVSRILHDWSEEKIRTLLAKIHARLPAGGALLVAEKLLQDDKTGPMWGAMQSLNMLVCTEGRERNLREYDALLRAAGFGTVEGRLTGAPLDAVLAVKN
ncbi:MAG: homocysteine methyltransferase [Candidatus Solibacter usitatus]|nr:homocysteine methyltransferase [Candidatus Solibacter usitatus]